MNEAMPADIGTHGERARVIEWLLAPGKSVVDANKYWAAHPDLPTLDNGWELTQYEGIVISAEQKHVVPSGPYTRALHVRQIPVVVPEGHDAVHLADYVQMMRDSFFADALYHAVDTAYAADLAEAQERGLRAEMLRWESGESLGGVGEHSKYIIGLWGTLTNGMHGAARGRSYNASGSGLDVSLEAISATRDLGVLVRCGAPEGMSDTECAAQTERLREKFMLPELPVRSV